MTDEQEKFGRMCDHGLIEVAPRQLFGEPEGNHEEPQSGLPVSPVRLELSTCRL
jgi:hypothetical protein